MRWRGCSDFSSCWLPGLKLRANISRSGHSLELIEYVRPEAEPRQTMDRAVLGDSNLAFSVEDAVGTLADMVSKGAKSLNSPAEVSRDRFGCCLQDPDGNPIEFTEDNNSDLIFFRR